MINLGIEKQLHFTEISKHPKISEGELNFKTSDSCWLCGRPNNSEHVKGEILVS